MVALSRPYAAILGGTEGIRTPDLSIAGAALSQLSYGPREIRGLRVVGPSSRRSSLLGPFRGGHHSPPSRGLEG